MKKDRIKTPECKIVTVVQKELEDNSFRRLGISVDDTIMDRGARIDNYIDSNSFKGMSYSLLNFNTLF